MTQDALEILNSLYGYSSFRGHQAEIIEQVCAGHNALVLMPTGGGKSLCYQIPALLRDGVGVIVSPLIALMQDQVDAMQQLGDCLVLILVGGAADSVAYLCLVHRLFPVLRYF